MGELTREQIEHARGLYLLSWEILRLLGFYGTGFDPERAGGVLQGCPRGKAPVSRDKGKAALKMYVRLEAVLVAMRDAKEPLALSASRAEEVLREPTDDMVSICLQTFRREMDKHMDLKHPSASPGHDSMRIALRAVLAARDLVQST